MASTYGLNFGFLRSTEDVRVAEGRYKTPVGSALLLGTMVEIDPASAGYLKASAVNAAVVTGFSGLLLQELEWQRSIYDGPSDPALLDSFQYGVAKPNALALVTSGAGTKVWFKNTASVTRADGRVTPARTMFDATGLAVGSVMGWDGAKWVKTNGTTVTAGVLKVTDFDSTKAYVAGVLLG